MTQASSATRTIAPAGPMTFEVSSELQKILSRHDQKGGNDDLKRLLAGEVLLNKLTPDVMATKGRIEQAILMAEGLEYLRSILTEDIVTRYFVPLQNNPRGFLTDRKPSGNDRGGYSWWIVRDCVLDAFSRGLPATDNHFNIIQERMYITRNGMTLLLQQLPKLTDLRIDADVPEMVSEGSIVKVSATWIFDGKHDSMTRPVPVKVNKGQGADAILGKADRKFKAALYSRLTGTVFTEEGEVDETLAGGGLGQVGAPVKDESASKLDAIKQTVAAQTAPELAHSNGTANGHAKANDTKVPEPEADESAPDRKDNSPATTASKSRDAEPLTADQQMFLDSLKR